MSISAVVFILFVWAHLHMSMVWEITGKGIGLTHNGGGSCLL
jgi:hypothetical protein